MAIDWNLYDPKEGYDELIGSRVSLAPPRPT
jgi:hypothetical protein